MASVIFLIISIIGVALVLRWAYWAYKRADLEEKVEEKMQESELLRDEAEKIESFREHRGEEEEEKDEQIIEEFIEEKVHTEEPQPKQEEDQKREETKEDEPEVKQKSANDELIQIIEDDITESEDVSDEPSTNQQEEEK